MTATRDILGVATGRGNTRQQPKGVPVGTGWNGVGQDLFEPEEWHSLTTALGLSPRESGVVRSVFDGASEKRIAEQFGLSPHTVHTYLWRIYRKLHVQSRQELLVRVFAEFRSLSRVDTGRRR
jgi:DNA-binding CsgD family transcriptional regulator